MKRYLYFLGLIFLLLPACAIDDDIPIDPCMDEFVGTFDLLPTSEDVFPYLDLPLTTNFVFVNEMEEEIQYNMDAIVDINVTGSIPKPCPENDELELIYRYESGFKAVNLLCEDNPLVLRMSLQTRLDFQDPTSEKVSDIFSIFARDSDVDIFTAFQVYYMVVDPRNSDGPTFGPDYFETITIGNKTFTDIYKTNFSDPFLTLYYSFEEGIVAFTDLDDVQWVLDRIE